MVIPRWQIGNGFEKRVWKVCWELPWNTVCKMLYVQNLYFTSEKVMILDDDFCMHKSDISISQCCWQLVAVGICESIITKVASKIARRKKLAPMAQLLPFARRVPLRQIIWSSLCNPWHICDLDSKLKWMQFGSRQRKTFAPAIN